MSDNQKRLAAFGREVLWQFYNEGHIGDLDGAWLEDKAYAHGLTDEVDDGWRPNVKRPKQLEDR